MSKADKPTMPLNVYYFCIMVGSIRHRKIKKEELDQYMKDYKIKSIQFKALTNDQFIETNEGEIFRIDERSLL